MVPLIPFNGITCLVVWLPIYDGLDYVYGLLMNIGHRTQCLGDGSHLINIFEVKEWINEWQEDVTRVQALLFVLNVWNPEGFTWLRANVFSNCGVQQYLFSV